MPAVTKLDMNENYLNKKKSRIESDFFFKIKLDLKNQIHFFILL